MNEEALNMSVRRFLKKFGITAQREIEKAVRDAVRNGGVDESGTLHAVARLRIESIGLDEVIEGEITLE